MSFPISPLPFFRPSLGEREFQSVVECLRSGWITTGPRTREFEQRFAAMIGSKEAVALNSCTAAMTLALEAKGVSAGDEVIVPTLTFVATAEAALRCGATPVLVDCRKDDFTIDPAAVEVAITSRTRAIIPMHYGGHACDLDALAIIAKARDLAVIEDAAHVITGWHKGARIGASGNPTCFSFHATKPFTTGEGGMLTTNDTSLAEKIRVNRNHGIRRDAWSRDAAEAPWAYDIEGVGHKCNPSDVLSAIGLAQLESIEREADHRKEIATRYTDAFSTCDQLILQSISPQVVHSHHLFPILLRLETLRIDRDEVMRQLLARGITTSIHYRPLHLFERFVKHCRIGPQCGRNSQWVYERLISVPLYTRLTDQDVDRVISAVLGVIRENRR